MCNFPQFAAYFVTSRTQSVAKEEAMEFMKRLEPLWLTLVVLGALNWLMVGLFDTNVVAEIFGSGTASDVVYVIVGIAGIAMLPRLFADVRLAGDRTHPTGA
jgi:uncharacterized membrane protein YuzA (DUF378 family)